MNSGHSDRNKCETICTFVRPVRTLTEASGVPEAEESRDYKNIRAPKLPSQEEIDLHNMTHFPYRSWCPHCTRGHAQADHHQRIGKEDQDIPVVSVDYFWLKDNEKKEKDKKGDEGEKDEKKSEGENPIVAIYDRKSEWIAARVIKAKGKEEVAVRRVADEIRKLGYKRLILKSDQERAEITLKEGVRRELMGEVIFEESPVGEHASNGEIESAIKRLGMQVRTMKDALEARYKEKITRDHPSATWLIGYAGDIIKRYRIGEDGKTVGRE